MTIVGILWVVFRGSTTFRLAGRFGDRTGDRWRRDALLFSLGLCTYILTDPFVHGQYFILVLPMAAILFGGSELPKGAKDWEWIKVCGCVAGLLMITIHPLLRWHTFGTVEEHLWNYAGAATIFVLGIMHLMEMSRTNSSTKLTDLPS